MNCKKCGAVLAPTDIFCKNCGEPVSNNNMTSVNQPHDNMNVGNAIPTGDISVNQTSQSFVTPEQPVNNEMLSPQPTPSMNDASNFQQPTPVSPVSISNDNMNNMTNNQSFAQQPMANTMGPVNTPQPAPVAAQPVQGEKKNNTLFIVIVVVLLLIIVGLGVFLAIKKFGSKPTDTSSTVVENDKGDNNQIGTSDTNSNIFEYADFQLPVPVNYEASIDNKDGLLTLINSTKRLADASLFYRGYTIDDIKDSIDGIKANLEKDVDNVYPEEYKEYNGVDWVVIPLDYTSDAGQTINALCAISSLGNYHISENYIYFYGEKDVDSVLNDLSSMYKNATYKGTKQFSADDEKDQFKDIAVVDLGKKLSN